MVNGRKRVTRSTQVVNERKVGMGSKTNLSDKQVRIGYT